MTTNLDPVTKVFFKILLLLVLMSCYQCAPWTSNYYPFTHPAVVRNAYYESRLSPHQRNPFYQDPRTARALARFSYLGDGEMQVYTREAEKISRREIYKVLAHAGLLQRYLSNPEHLQRL